MTQERSLQKHFDQSDQQDLLQLVDELTPKLHPSQARALLGILVLAQTNPPKDKKSFVDRVNRLFDLYRICISIGDDQIYRLRYLAGGSGKGHIYLLDGNRNSSNMFYQSSLRLIDIGSHFEGNKRVSGMSIKDCPTLAAG